MARQSARGGGMVTGQIDTCITSADLSKRSDWDTLEPSAMIFFAPYVS